VRSTGKPLVEAWDWHLGCDIRVAAEAAQFGCPEPKFGTVTRVDIFEPYRSSAEWQAEVLLMGDSISARRAYELNLVNRVVLQEQLLDNAIAIAKGFVKMLPWQ